VKEDLLPELKNAITFVEIIVAAAAVTLLGDYLGYKIGRWRLVAIVGLVVLASIVAFAVYADVTLA
jgi:hypothetical protein